MPGTVIGAKYKELPLMEVITFWLEEETNKFIMCQMLIRAIEETKSE